MDKTHLRDMEIIIETYVVALKKRSDQTSLNCTLLKKGISYYNQAIQKQKGLKYV
jgi:hypothetical protein